MANKIRLKRGLFSKLKTSSLADGEVAITTDTNKLYSNKGEINPNNVYVGTSAPTDSNIQCWVNPNGKIDLSSLWNQIYPVGSIYMSVNSTNPGTLFGGTWSQIKDTYLLACGTTYAAGTGGSATSGASSGSTGGPSNNTSGSTVLTVDQIPAHTHPLSYRVGGGSGTTWYTDPGTAEGWNTDAAKAIGNTGGGQGHTHTLSSHTHSLNSHTHSVLPPYTAVYVWKRVS